MLDFIQVLNHAGIVQSIGPEGGHKDAEELEKSQRANKLSQHEEQVVPLNVDCLFERVLSEVD